MPTESATHERTLTVFLRVVGHALFFGSIYYLNNPFVEIATAPRFVTFVGMLALGAVLVLAAGRAPSRRTITYIVVTLLSILTVMVRVNYAQSMTVSYQNQILQAGVAMSSLLLSLLLTDSFDSRLLRLVTLVAAGSSSLWICMNYQDLFDYSLKDSYTLGNLSFDSYQTAAQTLGIFVIAAAATIKLHGPLSPRSLLLAIISAFCLFVMLQGYARGEALAVGVSLAVLMLGRTLFIGILAVLAYFSGTILSGFDFPLFERLRSVLEGDLGERDVLFAQAVDILRNEPFTALTGGGISYFQRYYSYTFDLYPHNIFIEALITGGVLMFLSFVFIFLVPLVRYFFQGSTSPEGDFLFALCVFLTIVYAKSGTLSSFWGLAVFACAFLTLGRRTSPVATRGTADTIRATLNARPGS